MQQPLVPAETRITNPFNKETFVFTHPVEDDDTARFDVVLGPGGSGGGNAIPHIHPKADETFAVHSGLLLVVIDGVAHWVGPGEQATIRKGAAHFFRNAHDGETHATVSFTPAQQHLRFFVNLARWTAENPGNFSARGDARLLPMALALHAYRDHLYIASLPIRVQKVLFALLAPVARLLGHRLAVEPRPAPEPEPAATQPWILSVERN